MNLKQFFVVDNFVAACWYTMLKAEVVEREIQLEQKVKSELKCNLTLDVIRIKHKKHYNWR